jgi:hypothetical protein
LKHQTDGEGGEGGCIDKKKFRVEVFALKKLFHLIFLMKRGYLISPNCSKKPLSTGQKLLSAKNPSTERGKSFEENHPLLSTR